MKIVPPSVYPDIFKYLLPPADVLYYAGQLSVLDRPSVTIVGSRHPSDYGRAVTKQLVEKLIQHDIVIISGFALGIDVTAHLAALSGRGQTIAVLGCGLDVAYPRAHHHLKTDIIKRGLLLSEYPAATRPKPHHFPRRNRLLAALGDEVIVVECLAQSGSLITIDYAIDFGKTVHAVPGRISDPLAGGPNQLIQDGANPIIDIDLFIDEFLRRNYAR